MQIVEGVEERRPPAPYENPFRDAEAAAAVVVPGAGGDGVVPARAGAACWRASARRPTSCGSRRCSTASRTRDPAPAEGGPPVAASVEVKTCPWNVEHRLARVAIRARDGGATVVARGVDVSIEFNPDAVRAWRLIGYENAPAARGGQPTGFATDLAAGGAATALYEIVPTTPVDARAAGAPRTCSRSASATPTRRAPPSGVITVARHRRRRWLRPRQPRLPLRRVGRRLRHAPARQPVQGRPRATPT